MAAIHVACLVVFFEAASASRDGRVSSFLVLGDWGWDPVAHGNVRSRDCQQLIANKMDEAFEELGDVKFIINVGDSFYPLGFLMRMTSNGTASGVKSTLRGCVASHGTAFMAIMTCWLTMAHVLMKSLQHKSITM